MNNTTAKSSQLVSDCISMQQQLGDATIVSAEYSIAVLDSIHRQLSARLVELNADRYERSESLSLHDLVKCTGCSTRTTVVTIAVDEIAEHNAWHQSAERLDFEPETNEADDAFDESFAADFPITAKLANEAQTLARPTSRNAAPSDKSLDVFEAAVDDVETLVASLDRVRGGVRYAVLVIALRMERIEQAIDECNERLVSGTTITGAALSIVETDMLQQLIDGSDRQLYPYGVAFCDVLGVRVAGIAPSDMQQLARYALAYARMYGWSLPEID